MLIKSFCMLKIHSMSLFQTKVTKLIGAFLYQSLCIVRNINKNIFITNMYTRRESLRCFTAILISFLVGLNEVWSIFKILLHNKYDKFTNMRIRGESDLSDDWKYNFGIRIRKLKWFVLSPSLSNFAWSGLFSFTSSLYRYCLTKAYVYIITNKNNSCSLEGPSRRVNDK